VVSHMEIQEHLTSPRLGARGGPFIVGDQGSYYSAVTTLNYISQL
jgi:hypothetical protein